MSQLGIRWKIDGVPAAFITRGSGNGQYRVTFEREAASLEDIERIDWSRPAIQCVTEAEGELGLPEGYSFELTDLRSQHACRQFVAELQTARQYLGDVTEYQAQIQALNETVADQQAAIKDQAARMAAMEDELEAAYTEGVERNG